MVSWSINRGFENLLDEYFLYFVLGYEDRTSAYYKRASEDCFYWSKHEKVNSMPDIASLLFLSFNCAHINPAIVIFILPHLPKINPFTIIDPPKTQYRLLTGKIGQHYLNVYQGDCFELQVE
jgi:hypothetical protein